MLREATYSFINNSFSSIIGKDYSLLTVESSSAIQIVANHFQHSEVARVIHLALNNFISEEPALVRNNKISSINGSSNGIGLYLESSPNILIQDNQFNQISFLQPNRASEAAGVYIDQLSTNVTVDSNAFTHCRADIGGALSYKNSFVSFFTNTYSENEGSIYGQNVAAFPVALELRSYTELPQIYKDNFPRLLI